jgi:hypothetical protein
MQIMVAALSALVVLDELSWTSGAAVHLPADTIAARAEAAVLGGFVADAAAMPLHWIYDINEIQRLVGDSNPEVCNLVHIAIEL